MAAMARESSAFDMPWSFRTVLPARAFRVATADQKYLKANGMARWHRETRWNKGFLFLAVFSTLRWVWRQFDSSHASDSMLVGTWRFEPTSKLLDWSAGGRDHGFKANFGQSKVPIFAAQCFAVLALVCYICSHLVLKPIASICCSHLWE